MKLLMVRHGEILSNLKKVYSGRSDEKLTEKGIAQANDLSFKLKNYKIDALYSSPMARTSQTAEIIGEALGENVIIENAFQELKMGLWEGLSEVDVKNRFSEEWQIWQKTPAYLKMPGREMLDELLARVLSGLRKIHQSRGDITAAIVTHVAIIRVLILWQTKKNLNFYKKIDIPNAEVFEISCLASEL